MGVIKILSENLSNLIAAGEVVENPASLVKELLENSLDAESTQINISIRNGGKSIEIIDNGKGMGKDDLLLCVERHATSKISKKEDLFNLFTYGFRGEALSSIAAVSKMTISSKERGKDIAHSLTINGGKITNIKEIQKSEGTTITINELFYNTPARLKFLRKDATENAKIREIVLLEALANPDVAISLQVDGKQSIKTSGKGIENAIIDIFGINILKNLKKFELGYAGNLSLTRATKDFIFIFVNNRAVKSKVIEEAILEGYYTRLMKGKYPFVIINYKIDPSHIDVNVHPSKKIIKFDDDKAIFNDVYTKIITLLDEENELTIFDYTHEEKKEKEEDSITQNSIINDTPFDFDIFFKDDKEINEISDTKIDKNFFSTSNKIEKKREQILESENITPLSLEESTDILIENVDINHSKIEIPKEETTLDIFSTQTNSKRNYKIIGQYRNSFILTEEDNDLILYDQHIVHERILYEKFKNDYFGKQTSSQQLLVPIKVTLNSKEILSLRENIEFFRNFGFEIDEFTEQEYLIRAIPNINFKDTIENIFFDLLKGMSKIKVKNEILEKMIISLSCKSAIKINESLSLDEMYTLLDRLHSIGQYTCPHGRPIRFRLTLHEIEKGFKRK